MLYAAEDARAQTTLCLASLFNIASLYFPYRYGSRVWRALDLQETKKKSNDRYATLLYQVYTKTTSLSSFSQSFLFLGFLSFGEDPPPLFHIEFLSFNLLLSVSIYQYILSEFQYENNK
jgi:hypothetical protein